jgi:hypothetical protein
MNFLVSLIAGIFLFPGGLAFADTNLPLCLTISHPAKWNAGLVLKVYSNPDGSLGAGLYQLNMFRGESSQTPDGQTMGAVNGFTAGKSSAGGISYAGGTDGNQLNIALGAPDESGDMAGSVDIQIAGMDIQTKGASLTRFNGNAKCE